MLVCTDQSQNALIGLSATPTWGSTIRSPMARSEKNKVYTNIQSGHLVYILVYQIEFQLTQVQHLLRVSRTI